jgi:hypothetical protein
LLSYEFSSPVEEHCNRTLNSGLNAFLGGGGIEHLGKIILLPVTKYLFRVF